MQALLARRGLLSQEFLTSTGLALCLGLVYCSISAGLIAYNKYLIHEDRFPFAVPLVLFHMLFCSGFTGMLYLLQPSLFPSLTDPACKVVVDRKLVLGGALPIAVLFAVQLALSNTAYLHSSVAFLQMMKEANLVLVYALSLLFSLERFSWRSIRILTGILLATAMTIRGEAHFSAVGFTIQGVSQIFESMKIVLQAMLLSNAGKKLDALTYILLVMPLCFLVLGSLLCVLLFVWPSRTLATPHISDMSAWWPHLLANACVAFLLNVTIALVVKKSSAVAFILCGIVKDASILLAGGVLLRELITLQQGVGFGLQLSLITVYSLAKTFPEKFECGLFGGLAAVLGGNSSSDIGQEKAKDYGAIEKGRV